MLLNSRFLHHSRETNKWLRLHLDRAQYFPQMQSNLILFFQKKKKKIKFLKKSKMFNNKKKKNTEQMYIGDINLIHKFESNSGASVCLVRRKRRQTNGDSINI